MDSYIIAGFEVLIGGNEDAKIKTAEFLRKFSVNGADEETFPEAILTKNREKLILQMECLASPLSSAMNRRAFPPFSLFHSS